MKRLSIIGLAALLVSVPFTSIPGLATTAPKNTLAQNVQTQPKVQLRLTAAKKIVQKDAQGKNKVTWQSLQGNVTVKPGDVIRYIVIGANNGDREASNLVVTQPIPKQTAYVLNSSTTIKTTATVTYSIDNGKTFVAKPTVQVKLANGKVETRNAPAEAYTHVRWKFTNAIAAKSTIAAAYQVRVK
jgi:uncharacterized repeat protein (TIGR01451 family)